MNKFGSIYAVCISPEDGIPKYPIEKVIVGTHGFVGDWHNKEMRRSFSKPGTLKENLDRHITLVGHEAIKAVEEELRVKVPVGGLAENILTLGLGDLSDIVDDSIIIIGRNVRLIVTGQNSPCNKVRDHYSAALARAINGRRGLLCRIEYGVGEVIASSDPIAVYTPVALEQTA